MAGQLPVISVSNNKCAGEGFHLEKLKVLSLYTNFRKDLNYIEKELEKSLRSASPTIQEASMHLLKAGGKRIRPIFVLLAAEFGNFSLEKVGKVAVALELVHMASLVHDDVIDNSEMRRGHPTVKAKWNNRIAMYTGDYIFSQALVSIADIEKRELHQLFAKTMLEICEGEVIQIEHQRAVDQSLRDYLRRIKRKTALLLSSSCELGAIVADADETVVRKMRRFGYYAGMSFQITDDILDFTATDKELGKPAGSDLLNGHLTLPALYLREDPTFKQYMNKAFAGQLTEKERKEMLAYVRHSTAIQQSVDVSNSYLEKAREQLEGLPNIKAKEAFIKIANFIGQRKF